MKKIILLSLFWNVQLEAQELFVFTEPASTMPTNMISARWLTSVSKNKLDGGINFNYLSEIHYGISSKMMIQAEAFFNSNQKSFAAQGAGIYLQYKFLNNDEVKKHFRMAAFGRLSFVTSAINQEEIENQGYNSGYQIGVIATQLLHKVAISSTISYKKALNNDTYGFPPNQSDDAMGYTLSFGKLMLPKKYVGYNQTNLNLMLEFLGQRLNDNGKSFLDIAPSVQFIIKSKARIDLGYRHELYSKMARNTSNAFIIRFEYNFYNVF